MTTSPPPAPKIAAVPTALALVLVLLAAAASAGTERTPAPILNGVPPTDPAAAAVGGLFTSRNVCSTVVVGCRTLLTAAHCVCRAGESAAECEPVGGRVLLPSAGVFDVTSVIHPDFDFGAGGDLAVLTTDRPIEGVAPLPLHPGARLPFGTAGRIAGFGRESASGASGLLRVGGIETASCAGTEAAPANHVCWRFEAPIGPPGEDSSSCFGDSGGPLLVAGPGGERVGGVLSGTETDDCAAPTTGWATDVAVYRPWIESTAGEPLGGRCSQLQVGDPGVGQARTEETVPAGAERRHVLHLPTAYDRLVVGFSATGAMDFEVAECSRVDRFGGVCELTSPAPGALEVRLANREPFPVAYQLTATGFGGGSEPVLGGPCVPDPTTLCLQDGRFRVRVRWRSEHGTEGDGRSIATTADDSGIFTFFSAQNWELMVKVLDACIPTLGNRFWVFYAATTNQEFTLTVEDTETGELNTYFNPLHQVAETRLDTDAFATCP